MAQKRKPDRVDVVISGREHLAQLLRRCLRNADCEWWRWNAGHGVSAKASVATS